MEGDTVKRCPRCKQLLELADFYKNRSNKDGLTSYCKACSNASCKTWHAANSEKANAACRRWYEANSEKKCAADRERYAVNSGRIKAIGRQRYEANPEQARATARKQYAANSERANATSKRWHKAHPEKIFACNEVRKAVNAGILDRLPCENCGREKSEGHHEDYSQPLVVTWLCRRCHKRLHAYKREREFREW